MSGRWCLSAARRGLARHRLPFWLRHRRAAGSPRRSAATAAAAASLTVDGHVVAEGGTPGEPRVTVQTGGEGGDAVKVDVDADGRFTFTGKSRPDAEAPRRGGGLRARYGVGHVAEGASVSVTLTLTRKLPSGQIRGLIRSFKGDGLDAAIKIAPGDLTLHTKDGRFEADVAPGTYDVTITAPGYETQRRRVDVEQNGVTLLNADLRGGAMNRARAARGLALAGLFYLAAGCARRGEPVASLIESQGTVERSDGSDTWASVAPGFAFVVGDVFKTSAHAQARLRLTNGTVIRVLEKARIRFARGTLAATKAPDVNVELGSAEVDATASEVALVTALGVARIERGARVRVSSDGARSTLEVVVGARGADRSRRGVAHRRGQGRPARERRQPPGALRRSWSARPSPRFPRRPARTARGARAGVAERRRTPRARADDRGGRHAGSRRQRHDPRGGGALSPCASPSRRCAAARPASRSRTSAAPARRPAAARRLAAAPGDAAVRAALRG
jgi:hypothetical protein